MSWQVGHGGNLEAEALAIFVHPASVDFGSAGFAVAEFAAAKDLARPTIA